MTLTIFQFENRSVRFVGTAEKPEWVAQDVCNILGNGEAPNALRNFKPNQKGMCAIQTRRQLSAVKRS